MASVLFRRGDIFERGADLTVLPCSAKSHFSKTAENHVNRFKLPGPSDKELGELEIHRFSGAGSITRYVAWAASVMEYRSSADIIRTIGQRLGEHANENKEIQLIESPLLGSGAGGLDPLLAGSALAEGFLAICTTDAILTIYAQQTTIIESLRETLRPGVNEINSSSSLRSPSAFISYSWDDDNHKKWVKELSSRLRSDGVDVALDQWDAVPGDQLPLFMENAIRVSDYVLIICTPLYRRKSEERVGGVGYEGDIMTAEVYGMGNVRKFIPVLARGTWHDAVPSWLKGKYGIDLTNQSKFKSGYNDLLTTIHGTREKAPRVGQKSLRSAVALPDASQPDDPIRILGVIIDEVTEPRLDGTHGSALYRIPFRLSRRPSRLWSELFSQAWERPPHLDDDASAGYSISDRRQDNSGWNDD